MSVADFLLARPRAAVVDRPVAATGRDPRLDFYRGIALVVILFSHTPGSYLADWVPGRWGFSDAAEMFVFCSGMSSALAFGATFLRAGWVLGTARVLHRVWQLYWAHLALFFVVAALMAGLELWGRFDRDYIASLNLHPFFQNPAPQLAGLVTLTYVPNYFDILPMYIVLLAMVPVMMALARVSPVLVLALSVTLWLLAQGELLDALRLAHWHLELPAEPWSDRTWFFNPFAWQLVFFTGFALMRGWLPAPPVTLMLVGLAIAIVVASMAFSSVAIRELDWDWVSTWRSDHRGWISKTDLGIVRYTQFLALAYLAWAAAGPGGTRLGAEGGGEAARLWQHTVAVVCRVGQQSLAVFIFSMVLARILGVLIDLADDDESVALALDLVGLGLLVLVAYLVAWFKSQPWRAKRAVP